MPNKQSKLNKRAKRLLNEKLNREGRTAKQIARKKRKKEKSND
tara:strand:- start:269 stop:397 length:129 start_codon:yes stop_codon:yes gene_type:complete